MEDKRTGHLFIKIICVLIIVGVILFLDARYLNPIGFKTKEVAVYNKKLSEDYNGFKIVQFSDMHYGRTVNEADLKKIVKEINLLKADIVVFTGDLFDSKKLALDNEELMIKYFKKIEAKLDKMAVIGDYDEKYLSTYKNILEKTNFKLLDNQSSLIYYKSTTPLNFIGLTDTTENKSLYDNNYFNITLMHKPDMITKITNSPLVLAGHSLGGQLKIPFIGGIIKQDGARTYIDDYYKVQGKDLYISNGLGTQKMSLRFLNKPSITLYRLYKD